MPPVHANRPDPEAPRRGPVISRSPGEAEREAFDLAIVGGGIHGILLLLEAVRRGLRPVLIEQADFGSGTTYHHLRTLHGGLRYLQTLDAPRFFESVSERRWFLHRFPQHTRPLPCLMPLYGDGLRRPSVMRIALALNDGLSFRRNVGAPPGQVLPPGRVVGPDEVRAMFPSVRPAGLKGGAVWYDAVTTAPQRIVMDAIRTACLAGGVALNYVRVTGLCTASGRVCGVRVHDAVQGRDLEIRASTVILAAGPWGPAWLEAQGLRAPGLFPGALRLWNVFFDRPALSTHALALSPGRGGHTYFVHSWEGRILAGTGETPVPVDPARAAPGEREMETFLADLNTAVPGLNLDGTDILRVHAGILPATRMGQLTHRAAVVDHARAGGPAGLFSLAGIKFTTARRVADRLLSEIFPGRPAMAWDQLPPPGSVPEACRFSFDETALSRERLSALAGVARDESVVHLGDLVLRRTNLADHPARALAMGPDLADALGITAERKGEALRRLAAELDPGLPGREDP